MNTESGLHQKLEEPKAEPDLRGDFSKFMKLASYVKEHPVMHEIRTGIEPGYTLRFPLAMPKNPSIDDPEKNKIANSTRTSLINLSITLELLKIGVYIGAGAIGYAAYQYLSQ
ncbi:MAG: hypothetical protein AABW91_01640 [Nanoarchaeota archaeon]